MISLTFQQKKNTPKGALCKYSNSFKERLLNCDALRAFLRSDWKVWISVGLKIA